MTFALLVGPSGLFGACAPIVDPAPFSQTPATTRKGDLLGPFEGQVLDGETEKPVVGALVSASWAFARGLGTASPRGAFEEVVRTDGEGRYDIPRLGAAPGGLSARVARFRLVIYKKGYVGYRSDHVFPDGAVRRDFAQTGHTVKLDRPADGFSHTAHLAFLAGSAEVRKAAAWELAEAGLEAQKKADAPLQQVLEPATARMLDASKLLTEDEIRSRTGFKGKFVLERLPDTPRSETYDTLHFRAADQGEHYDVALRVWMLGADLAKEEYGKLVGALPNVRTSEDAGTRSFRAGEGDILAVIFIDEGLGTLVQVTCGIAQCREYPVVAQLAKLIAGRLPALIGAHK